MFWIAIGRARLDPPMQMHSSLELLFVTIIVWARDYEGSRAGAHALAPKIRSFFVSLLLAHINGAQIPTGSS